MKPTAAFIFLFLNFSILFCKAQNRDATSRHDTVVYKTTLVPLESPKWTSEKVAIKKDPLDCYINVSSEKIKVKFSNIILKDITVASLDTFIRNNHIDEVSPQVYIIATKNTSQVRIKEVIDALQKNNVNKFNLDIK